MTTWNEIEDGFGCSGLVPTAAEKRAEQARERLERKARDYDALAARLAEAERSLAAIQSAAGNVCWYSYGDCDQDVQDAVLALERHVPDYCIVYKTADSADVCPEQFGPMHCVKPLGHSGKCDLVHAVTVTGATDAGR
jgi:hypothetical protein